MIEAHFRNISKEISSRLSIARSSIQVAVAWFTNEELFDILCKKTKSGLKVHLLINNDIINNNELNLDLQYFIDQGGTLYFSNPENLMHNKFCIIDEKILISGSYNWTYFAEYYNLENIILLENEIVIDQFIEEFEKIIDKLTPVRKVEKLDERLSAKYDITTRKLLLEDLSYRSFKHETNGNYSKAINIAQKAFELSPESLPIKNQIEKLKTKNRESSEANFTPSEIIVNNSKFSVFNSALKKGVNAYRKKEYSEAIKYLTEALQENDDFAEIYFWIGLCYWKINKTKETIDYCTKAISINNEFYKALNLRGIAFTESTDLQSALEDFNSVILNQNNFFKAYFNRGLLHKKMGKIENAKQDFAKTIEIIESKMQDNPFDEEALAIRGDALSLTDRNSLAKEAYLKAKEIFEKKSNEARDFNNEDRIKQGLGR